MSFNLVDEPGEVLREKSITEAFAYLLQNTLGLTPVDLKAEEYKIALTNDVNITHEKAWSRVDIYEFEKRLQQQKQIEYEEREEKKSDNASTGLGEYTKPLAKLPHDLSWCTQARELLEKVKMKKNLKLEHCDFIYNYFRDLNLSSKGITELDKDFLKLQNLSDLSICENRVKVIRNLPQSVVTLMAFGNRICDIKGVYPNTLHLGIGYNDIDDFSLAKIAHAFPNLNALDLSFNQLTSLEDTVKIIVRMGNLTQLSLCGNPITLHRGYREYVHKHLPNLELLDDVPLSNVAELESADVPENDGHHCYEERDKIEVEVSVQALTGLKDTSKGTILKTYQDLQANSGDNQTDVSYVIEIFVPGQPAARSVPVFHVGLPPLEEKAIAPSNSTEDTLINNVQSTKNGSPHDTNTASVPQAMRSEQNISMVEIESNLENTLSFNFNEKFTFRAPTVELRDGLDLDGVQLRLIQLVQLVKVPNKTKSDNMDSNNSSTGVYGDREENFGAQKEIVCEEENCIGNAYIKAGNLFLAVTNGVSKADEFSHWQVENADYSIVAKINLNS